MKKQCSVSECDRFAVSRGMCTIHYAEDYRARIDRGEHVRTSNKRVLPCKTLGCEGSVSHHNKSKLCTRCHNNENGCRWAKANPERKQSAANRLKQLNPDRQYLHTIKYKYGLEAADYLKMVQDQEGKCKICRDPPKTRRLDIDHCHETGKVRALICGRCNKIIGHAHDESYRLRLCADYLDTFKKEDE